MGYKRCNGIRDCPSGNDEDDCPTISVPTGRFKKVFTFSIKIILLYTILFGMLILKIRLGRRVFIKVHCIHVGGHIDFLFLLYTGNV